MEHWSYFKKITFVFILSALFSSLGGMVFAKRFELNEGQGARIVLEGQISRSPAISANDLDPHIPDFEALFRQAAERFLNGENSDPEDEVKMNLIMDEVRPQSGQEKNLFLEISAP